VIFDCKVSGPAVEEIRAANNKADLFEKIYKKSALIRISKKEDTEGSPPNESEELAPT